MDYIFLRSKIPIVFIDTFAVIDFYKLIKGQNNDRIKRLYSILKEKVSLRKIICPIAYQEDEINEFVSDSMKVFLPLSLGIRFDTNFDIRMNQFNQILCNYRDGNDKFTISYKHAFEYDPIEELKTKRDFIISAVFEPSIEDIDNRHKIKQRNIEELQNFKDSDYNSNEFEKQLIEEFKGTYIATKFVLDNVKFKTNKGEDLSIREYNQWRYLFYVPYSMWLNCFNNRFGLKEYMEFLLSDWVKQIPYIDIHTRLLTDILVSKKNIQSGDPQDIENIATFLPYCNYLITDRSQKNRIKRLGLDEKYKSEVFCMNDIDIFIEKIESL